MDYDKTAIPETYNLGRDHGPAFLDQWMNVVAAHVEGEGVRSVLDLGCGTGRFTQALAERFSAKSIGIDPSRKMLGQARRSKEHTGVFYAQGCGEALPLPSNSIDMIFISMVFHHFTDPELVAQECRRVLCQDGRVLLRTACCEKISMYPYVPFFPGSRPLLEERIPSLDFQRRVFEAASFRIRFSGVVTQEIAADYSAYADKLAARADSILISLEDKDFEVGIQAVRSARNPGPVVEPIDVLVFQK